jgi:hypothetical protein
MAFKGLIVALTAIIATSAAANVEPAPAAAAPEGTASTRYCLQVDPITGSRMETIQCRTRDDWASLGVDVDQEWAENGVKVLA